MTEIPWSGAEFEQQLRERGRAYHIHHPFNVMLNSGKATPAQIRGWVANRFYYLIGIPRKDAGILANCEVRAVRRAWVQRILDHDGHGDDPGGIDAWLRLRLNGSAGAILSRCDGARTAGETVTDLECTHSATELSHDVTAFLTFALAKRWLELRE